MEEVGRRRERVGDEIVQETRNGQARVRRKGKEGRDEPEQDTLFAGGNGNGSNPWGDGGESE
jgi:hypothetical protein